MDELLFYNPWWTGEWKRTQAKPFRREAFERVFRYLRRTDRIVVVKGPRRVGKTVLLYQCIARLLDEGIDPKSILYISFDNPNLRTEIDAILRFYAGEILRKPLETQKVYIFLDEVQFLKDWQYVLKKYHDSGFPIRFVVSGSSATLMRKGTESLMGRTVEEVMLPFSFREFFAYTTGTAPDPVPFDRLDRLTIKKHETAALAAFSTYIKSGGFPSLFTVEASLQPQLAREDIVEKALYRDTVALYDIKRPETLERLFLYLANTSAQTINVSAVATLLGLSRPYVSRYLTYLKNAYFVHTARKFSRSPGKAARGAEKVYCTDPALIRPFLSGEYEHGEGHIAESVAARHLFGKPLFYWKNYHEVDFILPGRPPVPIEVKYKNQYADKDRAGLEEFCRKFHCRKAVLLTKNHWERKKDGETTFFILPLWAFILFCTNKF